MKIKTTFSEFITIGEIKRVKEFAKSQKENMRDIVSESIKAVEAELDISFLNDPTEFEVTYYNDYQRPVVTIAGRAVDHNVDVREPGHWIYVEAYKSLDEPHCAANIYRREK